MSNDFSRILALAPHTDDIEFGAGGAVARWVEEGKEVFYVAFSTAEKSVPEGFSKNILEQEVKQSTKVLGIAEDNLLILKFEVRKFPEFRQDILEIMVSLREKLKPDLVLLPSLKDIHQDHHTIAEEGIRAFKYTANILAYEIPWNLLSFETSSFVILQKRHLDKKVQAIKCYRSQQHKHYASETSIYGFAGTRGVQINAEYAESFEIIRWVIR
jgi:LmbE family N-acetylglucosaminyl deacetylase